MASTVTSMTASDLYRLPSDHLRHELVNGELRTMAPAGFHHGAVCSMISSRLLSHVEAHKLGLVVGADTGFVLRHLPDTVRAPDGAFVKAARLPDAGSARGFFDGAPDLAIEVLSRSDTVEEVEEKVADYLETGCSQVWVINPQRKTLTLHEPAAHPVILRQIDTLNSDDVVPGFSCNISELFSL